MRLRVKTEVEPMTITAAAIAAGLSVSTLKNLERSGVCVPARDSAGRRLYVRDNIDAIKRHYAGKK
jgi:DNA-binding transcriptional MerR regulator